MNEVTQTILAQYSNSTRIVEMITSWNQALDPRKDIKLFYDNVWNIDTAISYGLDLWGRILGVSRLLYIPNAQLPFFGFRYSNGLPFNQATFYTDPGTHAYSLSDSQYRILLLAKAYSNICGSSAKVINTILKQIFGSSGKCCTVDNGDMTASYVFEFNLTPIQYAILTQSGVIPNPAGVDVSIVQNP
jgi:Protein of unknown function (DUF2612)